MDYSALLDELENEYKQPEQDDTEVRNWLKSFYKGQQNVDDIAITPQIRQRYETQRAAPREAEYNNEDIPLPVKLLSDLGSGTMGALSGALRGANWVGKTMSLQPQFPPEFGQQTPNILEDVAMAAERQGARSAESGFPEGSVPKLLAQGAGQAAVDVPLMSLLGIAPVSMATSGGSAAAQGATPQEQLWEGMQGAATGAAIQSGLGVAHKIANPLLQRGAQGAMFASMPAITGGSKEEIAAGLITGLAWPKLPEKKISAEKKGPTTVSQTPKIPEPKVPEVKAKVAESKIEFIEEKLPPKFEGKVSDAGIQPKSAEEGGAGKTVTSRAPEVLLNKNKEVKTYGQEGEGGFAKVNYSAEEVLAKKNLQDGKWYDVTSGPAKEITDPVMLENIRIAEKGSVEKPVSEVSTKETAGEEFKTGKFKTKDTKKPITSEEATKAIDDYTDTLIAKYGEDAALHAPIGGIKDTDLPYGPSPISKPELKRLNELYEIAKSIDNKDLSDWRNHVIKNSGLSERDAIAALKSVGFDAPDKMGYSIYSTARDLKNLGKDNFRMLADLYSHFAKDVDPNTSRHGKFRIGGSPENPRLVGESYDSDLRGVPWDTKALVKTEKIYNAIAETQGLPPISLSPFGGKKAITGDYTTTARPSEPKPLGKSKPLEKSLGEPPAGPGEAVAPKVKPTKGIIGRGLGKVTALKDSLPYKFKEAKKVYLDWVNKFQDVENLSKFAKDNGITLEKILDPQLAIRKKAGSVTTANSIIFDGTIRYGKNGEIIRTGEGLRPILENYDKASPIKDYKLKTDKLDKFLQANRTVTDLVDGRATPEQIRTAQARLGVMERSNPKEYKLMQETATRIYDYQKRVLNMLVESGMLSKESYDLITSKNKAYVPFERIMLEEQMAAGIGGKGGPAPRKVVFKMKGSEKDVKNTLESLLKKTYEIVDAVETNYVNRSIAQFSDVLPEFIQKIKQPMIPTKVTAGEIMRGNPNASGDINDVTIFRPRKSQLRNNEMLVYENGKASAYKLSDGLYQAVKTLDPKSSNMFLRFARGAKRVLQVGATATPEFALRNLMRDQTGAMINTKIKFKPFIDSISAISDIMGNKEIFKEYMASGGGMQSYADLNRNALAKTLNHLRGNRTVLEKMNVVTKLGDFSSLLETATRLGVYKAARRSGLKPIESGFVSAESTLDFRRSGSKGAKVNDVIAFFNAGLQGVDRMARAAKADPRSFTMKAIAAVTIPEMIFQVINSGDDEFKNSPRWRKDLFWHVPGVNVWIPKPFVVGQAFGSVPGRFMEYAITKDPHAFDGIVNTLLEAGSPVGMDAIGGLMPTALKPLMENAFNYNFFTQTNLYPEYKEKLLPGERHSKYTAETWKEIGGFLGVSPSKLENLYQGYTAGLGKYVTQGSDALIKSIRGDKEGSKPTELSDIPVVRGFVGRKAASHPEKLNQFYRAYEDIDKAYSQYKQYVNSDKMDKAEQYREDHPEIGFRSDFNSYRKKMSEIGKSIDEINKRNISDYEKRVYLKEWEEKRMELLDEILDKYSGKIKLLNLPKTITGLFQ